MKTTKNILLLTLLVGVTATFAGGCTSACGIGQCCSTVSAKAGSYPLDYFLVSGDKLGDMGKNYTTNYLGQEITFCCKDCVKEFNKDPDEYMKKLAAAQNK